MLALDLDEDGLMDIIAGSLDSEGIQAWRNRGDRAGRLTEGFFHLTAFITGWPLRIWTLMMRMDICAASFGEGIKIWPGKEDAFKIVHQRRLSS